MRVVVDTNVFVSAALKDRSFPALALHVVSQRGTLLKSAATERQLFEVLARPQLGALIDKAAVDWMRQLMAKAQPVVISERIAACRDPTDDKFLELAVGGRADIIVSGDADLLVLNPFRDIPVVSPATFVRRMGRAPQG
jgi:putative PIN family toxin of toxin-antitoxin system